MLPRVTKLPDAGDKGVGPGRGAGRIERLAVCLTPNQRGGRWQTVTLQSHSSAWLLQSFSPTLSSPLSLQPQKL